MRHHGFSCSSLYTVTPEQAQENLLIDDFEGEGYAELISRFAAPLPLPVILDLMGIPREELQQIKQWCDAWPALIYGRLPLAEQLACAHRLRAFQRYAAALIMARRATPQADMISTMVQAWDAGLDTTLPELAAMVAELLLAGNETTTCLLGQALRLLLEKPERWRALCANPNLISKAVEEILRFEAPLFGTTRVVTETTVVHGVTIPAGAPVLLLFGSGNHDERPFACPDEFDLQRPNARQHLSFGRGIHTCSGAPLARLHGRVALEVLTSRLPTMQLVPGEPIPMAPNLVRGPIRLVVEWHTGPAGASEQQHTILNNSNR